jgi:hypothetical protein
MIKENAVSAAGNKFILNAEEFDRLITDAGYEPRRRRRAGGPCIDANLCGSSLETGATGASVPGSQRQTAYDALRRATAWCVRGGLSSLPPLQPQAVTFSHDLR